MLAIPILDEPPNPPPITQGNGFPLVGEVRFIDDAADPNPTTLWGRVDCERRRRVRLLPTGGDPHPRADGTAQAHDGFRRLRVLDGDDVSGERCELGLNNHLESPVALYREGDRLITFLSLRLPARFPLGRDDFQIALQMKQSQPSDAGGGPPVLALEADGGRWLVRHRGATPSGINDDEVLWSAPARKSIWARFALDVLYSADGRQGSFKVAADLNEDGDALDERESSSRFTLQTLKRESDGDDSDGVVSGASIPSHLRVGIYHSDEYRCRRHKCSIDVDNVGVYSP